MNVGKNWHPIFGFITQRLDGSNYKSLYNEANNLRIDINKNPEKQLVSIGIKKVKSKAQIARLRDPCELMGWQEAFELNYSNGSFRILAAGQVRMFLLETLPGKGEICFVEFEEGPYTLESYNTDGAYNAKKGLDKLLCLIKESEGINLPPEENLEKVNEYIY